MRALVIGGSGFLGIELCKILLDKGIEVRSFQRRHSKELEGMKVQQILGSLEKEEMVDEAVRGCQGIFHCGGKVDFEGSMDEHFTINYLGARYAIRAGLKHKVKAFVHTSTPSVFINRSGIHGLTEAELSYSQLDFPYVQSKIAAEKQLLTLHREPMPYVILRPHQIWSDDSDKFSQGLLQAHSRLKIIGDGKNRIDSIHVSDAALAHFNALTQLLAHPESVSGKDFNLSSSRPFLLWEQINQFYLRQGLAPITDRISARTGRWFLKAKFHESALQKELSEYLLIQMSVDRWFDCTRAWRHLSFQCTRFQ